MLSEVDLQYRRKDCNVKMYILQFLQKSSHFQGTLFLSKFPLFYFLNDIHCKLEKFLLSAFFQKVTFVRCFPTVFSIEFQSFKERNYIHLGLPKCSTDFWSQKNNCMILLEIENDSQMRI